ncbi:MAG TPA: co-chaperone GroES [Candidatus Paceibacterota bacterium]|nr:co-chaperone GroES [Candidatus Paceibacterota bacterium]
MAKEAKQIEIQPLGDRVLIKPLNAEQKTASGIYIPDSAKREEKQQGKVVAVGRGHFNAEGTLVPVQVKVGEKVLFRANDWDKEEINGEEFYLVAETSIVGIIK